MQPFWLPFSNETFQNSQYRNQSAADSLADGGHDGLLNRTFMLVPNSENAVVDIRKLTDYCLNSRHEIGKHKARIFDKLLGLTIEDAEELKNALLAAVRNNEAKTGRFDRFGQRYTVDFQMQHKDKKATVRSGWIIETNAAFPHLTTCFIL